MTAAVAIGDNPVYRGLRAVHLERVGDGKNYRLVCAATGLLFCVEVSGILSEAGARSDPYRPQTALFNLRQALAGDGGAALRHFLRYSPWLLTDMAVKGGGLSAAQYGAMLARLLDLLLALVAQENPAAERWQDVHRLLLRARFLLLARLSQTEHRQEAQRYLPELALQVREAWQAWGQTLLQAPAALPLLLAPHGRSVEADGKLLLFQPQPEALWDFAAGELGHPFTERLLTGWFLPRYDVAHVNAVLGQLRAGTAGPGRLARIRAALAAHLYRAANRWRLPGLALLIAVLLVPLLAPGVAAQRPAWVNLTWLAAAGLSAGAAGVYAVFWGVPALRYSLPRITLAIVVGFVALVSSTELMTFALRAYDSYPPLAYVTACGSVLLAFTVIYLGARRRLDEEKLALRRAGLVLLVAAERSLLLGWLILAPAGSLLLHGSLDPASVQHQWPGPLGLPVYPQLIFVLSPLALFIGIFVQTIWEEYPLTHPI